MILSKITRESCNYRYKQNMKDKTVKLMIKLNNTNSCKKKQTKIKSKQTNKQRKKEKQTNNQRKKKEKQTNNQTIKERKKKNNQTIKQRKNIKKLRVSIE